MDTYNNNYFVRDLAILVRNLFFCSFLLSASCGKKQEQYYAVPKSKGQPTLEELEALRVKSEYKVQDVPKTEPAQPSSDLTEILKRSSYHWFGSGLKNALGMFRVDTGRYPSSDTGLDMLYSNIGNLSGWSGPYLRGKTVLDEWSNKLCVASSSESCVVFSAGPDGERDTEDDISIAKVER